VKNLDLCFTSGFERHNKVLDSTTTAVIHPYGVTKVSVPEQSITLVVMSRIPPGKMHTVMTIDYAW
jgi:hypothetical protein